MNIYYHIFFITFIAAYTLGCNNSEKLPETLAETPLRGKETVYCDEAVVSCFKQILPLYHNTFPDAKITLVSRSARQAMSELFEEKSRCIIVARNYLPDEDSLLNQANRKYQKIHLANDGLVFFVAKNYPLDTMNIKELHDFITVAKQLKNIYPTLASEPKLLIPGAQSSEYANTLSFFKGFSQSVNHIAIFFQTRDSVLHEVLKGTSIGIGYLSYIQKNPLVKSLKIGFVDTSGKRIPPQIVHQGFIIQNKYPFGIPIIAYLRDNKQNLPWGFATFTEKDPKIQKVLLDCGIIPVFAKYNLIQED